MIEEDIEQCLALGIDVEDLEDAGWSCDVCPAKSKVKCPKVECDFFACLSYFLLARESTVKGDE